MRKDCEKIMQEIDGRIGFQRRRLYYFARVALTKYCRLVAETTEIFFLAVMEGRSAASWY